MRTALERRDCAARVGEALLAASADEAKVSASLRARTARQPPASLGEPCHQKDGDSDSSGDEDDPVQRHETPNVMQGATLRRCVSSDDRRRTRSAPGRHHDRTETEAFSRARGLSYAGYPYSAYPVS